MGGLTLQETTAIKLGLKKMRKYTICYFLSKCSVCSKYRISAYILGNSMDSILSYTHVIMPWWAEP